MKINWFPGHMLKALKMMENEIKKIDVIIYVLDARAPLSCFNPKLSNIAGEKPIIFIINKRDLADENKLVSLPKMLSTATTSCLFMNSTESGAGKQIATAVEKLSKTKIDKMAKKGLNPILKAIVVGVPNSGKSTLVNNLCKKAKTNTGDKPGVTKGKQWVRVSEHLEVLDTPGTLWPNLDNEQVAKNLAYIGSVKNEVLDISELAICFIEDFSKIYPNALEKRYGVATTGLSPIELIEQIAKKKNLVIKGGDPDYDRVCIMILDDFRKGRLGKAVLDKI